MSPAPARTSRVRFALLALLGILAGAAPRSGAEPVRVASGGLELAVDSGNQRLFVAEVRNPRTGYRAIVPDRRPNLWRITLKNSQGDVRVVADLSDRLFTSALETGAGGGPLLRLWARDLPVGEEKSALDVCASVELEPASPWLSRWRISITNRSVTYGISDVQYPVLGDIGPISPRSDGDRLAYPQGLGRLIVDPLTDASVPAAMAYPSWYLSMQFLYYYGEERRDGLYLAAYDGAGYFKEFGFGRNYPLPCFTFRVTQYPEDMGRPGRSYESPYPVVIGVLSGDWMTAAKTYRGWATGQRWCQNGQLPQRVDVPASLKEVALWPYAGLALRAEKSEVTDILSSNQDFQRLHAFSERDLYAKGYAVNVEATCQAMEQFQAYFGLPMIWWCSAVYVYPFDSGNPIYVTLRDMDTLVARLRRQNIATHPWTSAFAADMGTEWWSRNQAERYASKDERGAVPTFERRGVKSTSGMCMATSFWRDELLARHRDLVRQGMAGVYIDLLNSEGPQKCFDAAHGHPLGGGHYGVDSVRDMLQRTHAENRLLDQGFFTSGEEVGESYLDLNDASFAYGSVHVDGVPLFPAVYHDYTVVYGREPGKAAGTRGGYADPSGAANLDEFVTKEAQMFLWGCQLGIVQPDLVTYAPAAAAFLRTLARVYAQGKDYLLYGELLPGARVHGGGTVNSVWRSHGALVRAQFPVIGHSAWRGAAGGYGFAFVNLSAQTQTVDWEADLTRYGVSAPAGLGLFRLDENGRHFVDALPGLALRRTDVLPGLSAMLMEVGPAPQAPPERLALASPAYTVRFDSDLMESYKGDTGKVSVWIHNRSGKPLAGTIAMELDAAWEVRPQVPFACAVSERDDEVRYDVLVRVPETQADTGKLTVAFTCGERTDRETWAFGFRPPQRQAMRQHVCARRMDPVSIDGDLSDWPLAALTPITLDGAHGQVEQWRGREDLSARVYFMWDEQGLYLAAVVTDDVFSQPYQGRDVWKGDALQFGFVSSAHSEYGLALCRTGPYVHRWLPGNDEDSSVQLAVRRHEATRETVYEALFPAAVLGYTPGASVPKAGDRLRASFTVNEADAEGFFRGWLEWTPGICGKADPEQFGELLFSAQGAGLAAAPGTAAAPPQNLIPNGDFEQGLSGWFGWPQNAYVSLDTGRAGHGSALRVSNEPGLEAVRAYSPKGIEVPYDLPVTASYSFSARRRGADGNAVVTMVYVVRFVDGTNTNAYCELAGQPGEWQDYAGSFTIPAGKPVDKVFIWPTICCDRGREHVAAETAWFDDLVLSMAPGTRVGDAGAKAAAELR